MTNVIQIVVDFFNVILGDHPVKSVKFWETKLPKDLNKQFEGGLSEYGILLILITTLLI